MDGNVPGRPLLVRPGDGELIDDALLNEFRSRFSTTPHAPGGGPDRA